MARKSKFVMFVVTALSKRAEPNEHPNTNTNRTTRTTRTMELMTVMKQKKQSGLKPWKPGQSGNPAGRPLGARSRITEKLLADIADVWEAHGQDVLQRLAKDDPGKLATIAYGLLPRDVFVSITQPTPGNLEPEAWASLRRLLDLIESAGADGDPRDVFGMIEEDLRARLALPVNGAAI